MDVCGNVLVLHRNTIAIQIRYVSEITGISLLHRIYLNGHPRDDRACFTSGPFMPSLYFRWYPIVAIKKIIAVWAAFLGIFS